MELLVVLVLEQDLGLAWGVGLGHREHVASRMVGGIGVDPRAPPPPDLVTLGPEVGVRVAQRAIRRRGRRSGTGGASGRPGVLPSTATASTRNPSTPRSNQNSSIRSNISTTSGQLQFQSGCCGRERLEVPLPGTCRPAP